jgi:hypothetical protein
MLKLVLCLLLSLMGPYCYSQENLSPSSPSSLTAEEVIELKYVILGQLKAFKIYLTLKIPEQADNFQKKIDELQAILDKERLDNDQELAALERKIVTSGEYNKITSDQLQFYKNAYEVCVKADKRGFWCGVKKFFTLGGAKCH